MSKSLFKPGGPHRIRKTGPDTYSMYIEIPNDTDGYRARECLNASCSPGYFKIKGGTGITENHTKAYCPYCGKSGDPDEFSTKEQSRYAQDITMREVNKGIDSLVKDAFGLSSSGRKRVDYGFFSMDFKYKPSQRQRVRRPFEDEVRRDVICPHCGLDQTVFGLAIWCADCGKDIFLTHVEAEYQVIEAMIGDIDRRRELLGKRIAAKDIENCLEDIVSIQEAVLKAITKRRLLEVNNDPEAIESIVKKVGNSYQNMEKTQKSIQKYLELNLADIWDGDSIKELGDIMQKRHPITHNLGVVDKKYLDSIQSSLRMGREVLVGENELIRAIELSSNFVKTIFSALFDE